MRVLIISQVWEPESGTPQRRWRWLTGHLRQAGHEVVALVPPPHYPDGRLLSEAPEHQARSVSRGPHGETIYRCDFHEHNFSLSSRLKDQATMAWSQFRLLRSICRDFWPDVILATAPPLPAVYTATLASLVTKAPLIVDLRDAWPDLLENMGAWDPRTQAGRHRKLKDRLMPVVMRLGGWTLNKCLDRAAGLITTSDAFSARHRAAGKRHVLTLRNFGSRRSQRLGTQPSPGYSLNVLYAGTVGRAQGLSNAVYAAKIAITQGVNVRLRIVGTGVDVPFLRKLANELDVPVDFREKIPFADVPEHYEWAHTVLVHLRNWRAFDYTLPSKLYEALELRRHISLVARGEAADIVQLTQTGHCVEPEDPQALAELWQHLVKEPSLLDVGTGGLTWLDEHGDPNANGERFVDFVHEVTHAARRR